MHIQDDKALKAQRQRLQQVVEELLAEARAAGATAAEASASSSTGLEVTVRLGEVETIEHTRDNGVGITVYFGQRKGNASTADLDPQAIRDTLRMACDIARFTNEDPYAGLADAALMARSPVPDLDLYHPWDLDAEGATRLARTCEAAALAQDPRISNSEGASVSTGTGLFIYGNSHGFVDGYATSRHGLSCSVVAQDESGMQRDYWWTSARAPGGLEAAESVGVRAGQRTVARLGARTLTTRKVPVLFQAEVASGLLYHLIGAIRGGSIYRRASFLLDALNTRIFPDWVHVHEKPWLPCALGSAPFDSEGVATRTQDFIRDGVLLSWVLDSYAARKLGMISTGNSGGVRNLTVDSSGQSFAELLRGMDTGVLVTELMGQGVNTVTGDYSRGASGFWVEGGEIQYPVEEITIASNLKAMFAGLQAVGTDVDLRGSTRTGSWLIDCMTVAGAAGDDGADWE